MTNEEIAQIKTIVPLFVDVVTAIKAFGIAPVGTAEEATAKGQIEALLEKALFAIGELP